MFYYRIIHLIYKYFADNIYTQILTWLNGKNMEKSNIEIPLWKTKLEQRRQLEQRINIVGGKIYNSSNQILVLADVNENDENLILNDYLYLKGEKFTEDVVNNNVYDFNKPDIAFKLIEDLIKYENIYIPYMTIKAPWEIDNCCCFLEEKGFCDEFINKFINSNTRGISSKTSQNSVVFKLALTNIKEINKVFNFAKVMSFSGFGHACHLLWAVKDLENNQFKTSLGTINGIDGIKNLLKPCLSQFRDIWLWQKTKDDCCNVSLPIKKRLLNIQKGHMV